MPRTASRLARAGRAAAIALAAGFLASSTAAVRPAQAQAPTPITIRFADQVGSEVDYAAVWVAEKEGYFKDAGITIHRDTYSNGPEGLLHFANGEEDAMVGGLAPFMEAAARGTKFVMVMSVTKNNAPLVGQKSLNSYADLQGKTVATPGLGTVQDAVLSYAAEKYHVTFKKVFAKVTAFVPMLQNHEIDAFIGWEPAAATAISLDPSLHYIAQNPPLPNAESLEMIFTPAFASAHPDVVRAFVHATLKGIDYIQHHSATDVAQIVADKMNQPNAVGIVETAMKSVVLTDPKLDMPSTRIILKTAAAQGKLPASDVQNVDAWMNQYINYSFLK